MQQLSAGMGANQLQEEGGFVIIAQAVAESSQKSAILKLDWAGVRF
jgi:hypothetical protein